MFKNGDGDEFADNDDTDWCGTVGGGPEYAFTDDLSACSEYRYKDLGKIDAGDAAEGGDGEAGTAFNAVRAGLS